MQNGRNKMPIGNFMTVLGGQNDYTDLIQKKPLQNTFMVSPDKRSILNNKN